MSLLAPTLTDFCKNSLPKDKINPPMCILNKLLPVMSYVTPCPLVDPPLSSQDTLAHTCYPTHSWLIIHSKLFMVWLMNHAHLKDRGKT